MKYFFIVLVLIESIFIIICDEKVKYLSFGIKNVEILRNDQCHKSSFCELIEEFKTWSHRNNLMKKWLTNVKGDDKPTSVWCNNSTISGLRCKFQNLYYRPDSKQFVFIYDGSSIIYGIDNVPKLSKSLFLSSVNGHNAFSINLAIIPRHYSLKFTQKLKYIHRSSLFFSKFKPDNLQHIFHDDLLPLYFTVKELSNPSLDQYPLVFSVGDKQYDTHNFLYETINEDIVSLDNLNLQHWICFSEAYFGLNKLSLWHDYNFKDIISNNNKPVFVSYQLLDQFRNDFLSSLNINTHICLIEDHFKVIIINRKATRKLLNVDDLKHNIIILLEKYNFKPNIKVMYLEEDGVNDIIREVTTSDMMIGMHGAALILSMFLPQNATLIELWPYGINYPIESVYKRLCEITNHQYIFWVNKDVENTILHPEYPTHYGGISNWSELKLPTKNVLRLIENTELEILECCDNPQWLLRIYQDTLVHIISETPPNVSVSKYSNCLVFDIEMVLKDKTHQKKEFYSGDTVNEKYLSHIEDLSCSIKKINNMNELKVIWNAPWNLKETQCGEMYLEIILKDHYNNINQALEITILDFHFIKKFSFNIGSISLWATPYCDDYEGQTKYIICE